MPPFTITGPKQVFISEYHYLILCQVTFKSVNAMRPMDIHKMAAFTVSSTWLTEGCYRFNTSRFIELVQSSRALRGQPTDLRKSKLIITVEGCLGSHRYFSFGDYNLYRFWEARGINPIHQTTLGLHLLKNVINVCCAAQQTRIV